MVWKIGGRLLAIMLICVTFTASSASHATSLSHEHSHHASSTKTGAAPMTNVAALQPAVADAKWCSQSGAAMLPVVGDWFAPSLQRTIIADKHAPLHTPRDLAFNPGTPDQLWIVNGGDNSMTIIHSAPALTRTVEHRTDPRADHFMAHPSALAFGGTDTTIGFPGTFATAQEDEEDFMGPTLFSSDLSVFAKPPPKESAGLGSHLDMLHESPLGMGIAWERDNIYWVLNGRDGALVRFDFKRDHGVGNSDHTDGEVMYYAVGQMKREPNVPSHMAYHADTGMLYIADTGHGRVAQFDTQAAAQAPAKERSGVEAGVDVREVDAAVVTDFIPPGAGLQQPSGLEIMGELIYVADHATGIIYVYDAEGQAVAQLDTGVGPHALMGITFGPDNALYAVDALRHQVMRFACEA